MANRKDLLDQSTIAQVVLPVTSRVMARPHFLQQVEGPNAPQVIELVRDSLTIGRSRDVDLRIPSEELSRTHVRLERCATGFQMVDLDSSNGVYLNEIKIYSAELRDGDTIQIGNVVFIYYEGR